MPIMGNLNPPERRSLQNPIKGDSNRIHLGSKRIEKHTKLSNDKYHSFRRKLRKDVF